MMTNKEETYYNDTEGRFTSDFEYTYDNMDRLIKVEVKEHSNNVKAKNEYTYENDKLKTIKAGDTTYKFEYDEFGNTKQVKIGDQTFTTKDYGENNGNLQSETFANNQTLSYTYDRFNRLTKNEGTNGSYTYVYNADSNIKQIVDSINNNTKSFTYDLAQRLVKEINSNGFTTEYEYDINNNVNNIKYKLNDTQYNTKYNFDNYNRLNSVVSDNSIWKKETDRLSRMSKNIISNEIGDYETKYSYENGNKTTTYVKEMTNGNNTTIQYEYYMNGNIKTIKVGDKSIEYYYDGANRLTREDNKVLDKTIIYTYDTNGNILNKKEYAYTKQYTLPENATALNTIIYTYGNDNWKDQLTNYNGKAITYDAAGNPLTYDGNTYTWQNGRQLAGISNNTKNQTITYKYNESGIRTQKTVNGTITNYYLDGTKVIYEQTGNNIIYYTYDENGLIIGLNYNGVQYYYIKNAQNDIIGILNNNLTQIVSYSYDSWGNIISITDANGNNITDNTNIGIINPYRYRSYRYDTETGLYYLQSRYYNPEWGRFLNADGILLIGHPLGTNIYMYCGNNPVNYYDPDGYTAIALPFIGTVTTTVSLYWPAIWENISYGVSVALNCISSAWDSAFGVKSSLQKVETPKTHGDSFSYMGGGTATPYLQITTIRIRVTTHFVKLRKQLVLQEQGINGII